MPPSQIPKLLWKSIQPQGKPPQPRAGHSAIKYQNLMIIFGGEDAATYETFCDVHILDLESWTWIQPHVSGEIPSPRSYHTAVLADEKMLVWGGYEKAQDGGYIFSDIALHILDLKTWQWSQINPSGTPPENRSHHSAALFQDKLLIDGGSIDIYSVRNDLHILDLTKMCWLPMQIENCSPSSLAGLKVRDSTLIKFLGDAAYGGFCSDIWTLDLAEIGSENIQTLQWHKAEFQGIENYTYKVLLPNSTEDEVAEEGSEDGENEEEDYEDDSDIIDWEDGIPYRTIHGYGEFGDNLVLFAGMAPGDGISHITIGNLVILNMPSIDEANSGTYCWMLPQVEGELPAPRMGHSTIQFNHQMIVYGGLWIDTYYGNNCYDNDVYILENG